MSDEDEESEHQVDHENSSIRSTLVVSSNFPSSSTPQQQPEQSSLAIRSSSFTQGEIEAGTFF